MPNKEKLNTPFNLEAEKAILGSVVLDPSKSKTSEFGKLDSDDFYDQRCKIVFDTLKTLLDNGGEVDLITVKNQLLEDGELENVGGVPFVSELTDVVATPEHIAHYVQIVKADSASRAALAISGQVTKVLSDGTNDVTEVLENAGRELLNIARRSNSTNFLAIGPENMAKSYMETLKRRSVADFARTPWDRINRILTCGFEPGKLSLIGGFANSGKSMLKSNLIEYHCEQGFGVISFGLEQGESGEGDRISSLRTNIPLTTIKQIDRWKKYNSDEQIKEWKQALYNGVKYVAKTWDYWLVVKRGITVSDMGREVLRIKEDYKERRVDIVYCDLFDRFTDVVSDAAIISEKLDEVSLLAQELNVHMCLLVQINRAGKNKPAMDKFLWSGKYEQIADLAFLINKSDVEGEEGIITVHIAKQRDGAQGMVHLEYDFSREDYTGRLREGADDSERNRKGDF